MTKFEIEINRNNVTPAQFLAYCRSRVDAKGGKDIRSDLNLDYFKRGDDLNFDINHKENNDDCYTISGCEREKGISHPYEMQTYIKWANGAVYNEICEFDFDDEKTGHGYYYLINVDAEEVEETAEAIAEETVDSEEVNETSDKKTANMKYNMNVIIADPNTPNGMTSDLFLAIECEFAYNPNQYGNGHYLCLKNKNLPFGKEVIDLRYDTEFDRNDKAAYLEKWARNYWNGKDGAYIVKSLKISEVK